eukprot:TRINITY_DN322_c0_g1_i1.p1 TRINITY_DN322_c0_g1~~TRINITY_DN322_c0_g1_i1.p1  ORF type:complete len:204 (-),score=14.67 TRINITY_DN322_c0_g1_i1:60-671(-)
MGKATVSNITLQLQKTVLALFLLTLIPFVNYVFSTWSEHKFVYGDLVEFLLNWIMLICAFKGAWKRRVWQLMMYNIMVLIAVFSATYSYSYYIYEVLHHAFGTTHHLSASSTWPLIISGIYYLAWMVLTILSVIQSTQLIVLLRSKRDSDIEMELESFDSKPDIQPGFASQQPQVVFYYHLVPGQTGAVLGPITTTPNPNTVV